MTDDSELHYHPRPPMNEFKRRNLAAVRVLDDEESEKLWNIIYKDFRDAAEWSLMPEEEPDEFDLEMIREIENDPDCHVFITSEELKRSLGMLDDEYKTA